MKLPASCFALCASLAVFAGVSLGATDRISPVPAITGPAADYPMVIGGPFTIDGVTYKPADTLNYDMVGYAALGSAGGNAINAAHRTLPLPSYVEVTSLESGKTALVRLERRGPMTGARLIELSPGAAAQLGLVNERSPVRVRRVNPPEPERSALRLGGQAPLRMDTPKPLLAALMRKLDQQNGVAASPVALPSTTPSATPSPVPTSAGSLPPLRRPLVPPVRPEPQATPAPAPPPRPSATPKPAATPTAVATQRGGQIVQVAALSTKARADALATKLGGRVSASGRLWRVRLGPFTTPAEASAALAKARAAGYSDARIQRAD